MASSEGGGTPLRKRGQAEVFLTLKTDIKNKSAKWERNSKCIFDKLYFLFFQRLIRCRAEATLVGDRLRISLPTGDTVDGAERETARGALILRSVAKLRNSANSISLTQHPPSFPKAHPGRGSITGGGRHRISLRGIRPRPALVRVREGSFSIASRRNWKWAYPPPKKIGKERKRAGSVLRDHWSVPVSPRYWGSVGGREGKRKETRARHANCPEGGNRKMRRLLFRRTNSG